MMKVFGDTSSSCSTIESELLNLDVVDSPITPIEDDLCTGRLADKVVPKTCTVEHMVVENRQLRFEEFVPHKNLT